MGKEKGYLLSNNGLRVIGKSCFESLLCFVTYIFRFMDRAHTCNTQLQ